MTARDIKFFTKDRYNNSKALIVGIDDYQYASKLGFAVSDAIAVHELLRDELEFPEENIVCLTNSKATRSAISKAFAEFTSDRTEIDDRIVVFFAGHGHTIAGNRGDQGFLVPVEGTSNDISTLIAWQELTHLSDLIRAKHMLFIMDACYSGLALTRSSTGTARFVQDMIKRYSRQVLTAGKADEVVADSGGPIPNHSIFTGHLLEGLRGKAAVESGIISASSLMAYVYNQVSTDKNSNQTPHFGHIEGDGDFILKLPALPETNERHETDALFFIPFTNPEPIQKSTESKIALTKELLADDTNMIKLHDFVMSEAKSFVAMCNSEEFETTANLDTEELTRRLSRYEEIAEDISAIAANIAFWARPTQFKILQKLFSQALSAFPDSTNGNVFLESLKSHPLLVLFYSAGIAAIEAENFDALKQIFYAPAPRIDDYSTDDVLAERMTVGTTRIVQNNPYQKLTGYDSYYVASSEYLFKTIQPQLDDLLNTGHTYEKSFDEFEILWAATVQHLAPDQRKFYVYPYIGRFGWKLRQRDDGSPLKTMLMQAKSNTSEWAPNRARIFGTNLEQGEKVLQHLVETVSKRNSF